MSSEQDEYGIPIIIDPDNGSLEKSYKIKFCQFLVMENFNDNQGLGFFEFVTTLKNTAGQQLMGIYNYLSDSFTVNIFQKPDDMELYAYLNVDNNPAFATYNVMVNTMMNQDPKRIFLLYSYDLLITAFKNYAIDRSQDGLIELYTDFFNACNSFNTQMSAYLNDKDKTNILDSIKKLSPNYDQKFIHIFVLIYIKNQFEHYYKKHVNLEENEGMDSQQKLQAYIGDLEILTNSISKYNFIFYYRQVDGFQKVYTVENVWKDLKLCILVLNSAFSEKTIKQDKKDVGFNDDIKKITPKFDDYLSSIVFPFDEMLNKLDIKTFFIDMKNKYAKLRKDYDNNKSKREKLDDIVFKVNSCLVMLRKKINSDYKLIAPLAYLFLLLGNEVTQSKQPNNLMIQQGPYKFKKF